MEKELLQSPLFLRCNIGKRSEKKIKQNKTEKTKQGLRNGYKRMMETWGKGTSFYLCGGANLIDSPELLISLISPAVKLCKCNTSENETLHLS